MTAKSIVHRAATVSGLGRLAQFVFRRRPLVLCYHGVCQASPDVPDLERLQVPRRLFEDQMHFLLRHYRPVTLQQVRRHLEGNCMLPARAVLVTFDDGYRNVIENALPILKALGIPCALFLVAGLVGTGRSIWTAELEWWHRDDPDLSAKKHRLKALGQRERAQALRSLLPAGAPLPQCDVSLARWEDLRPWVGADVAVGSHGLSHESLSSCGDTALAQELFDSRTQIEACLGVSVEALAYPNGDYSSKVIAEAKHKGYSLAFTTTPRHLVRGEDTFTVPRILVGARDHSPVLESRLSGWLEWVRRF
jgi:peptidoglycan/xylan/chitin deacetylase (PgdA/CDA1 family)